jgi:peptidoglycan/xylan/chitin deacetylase (PgdA/CDA1 family)
MNLNFAFVFAAFISATQAAIQNRCQANGVVALCFDDGPADYTGQLLNSLSDKKVKATFHLTTQYLTDPNVQETISRIAGDGHLVGLRTEPSWDLFQMSDDQIKASIARQSQVMAEFLGYQPILIRLPYKKYDDRVLRAIESTGAVVTVHNLETYDYTGDTNRILKAYQVSLNLAGKGAGSFISVQHDGVSASVSVVPQVIDLIRSLNYKIIKLDECLGLGDLTKNKKALDGGSGDYIPMEIDSSSGGLPLPSSGSGSGSSQGGFKGGNKPSVGGGIKKNSASAVKPFAFTAVAVALLSVVFAL